MRKPKKDPPAIVQFFKLMGDRPALSRLGRAGAMRKKEISLIVREWRNIHLLASLEQITRQANEHICPLD